MSYLATNHGYLVAIGHDDANGLHSIETLSVLAIDTTQKISNKAGLNGVDLVRTHLRPLSNRRRG